MLIVSALFLSLRKKSKSKNTIVYRQRANAAFLLFSVIKVFAFCLCFGTERKSHYSDISSDFVD